MFFEGHSPKFGRTRDVGLQLGGPTEDHHHQQRLAPGLPGLAGVPYFEGWRMTCPCRPCISISRLPINSMVEIEGTCFFSMKIQLFWCESSRTSMAFDLFGSPKQGIFTPTNSRSPWKSSAPQGKQHTKRCGKPVVKTRKWSAFLVNVPHLSLQKGKNFVRIGWLWKDGRNH